LLWVVYASSGALAVARKRALCGARLLDWSPRSAGRVLAGDQPVALPGAATRSAADCGAKCSGSNPRCEPMRPHRPRRTSATATTPAMAAAKIEIELPQQNIHIPRGW